MPRTEPGQEVDMTRTHPPAPQARPGDLVVGIDGSPGSLDAARYALAEAGRVGGRVRLVHVLPDYDAFGSSFLGVDAEVRAAGQAILDRALEAVGPPPAGVEVDLVLGRGPRVGALTSVARTAEALVVGADRRPVTSRVLTGNTTSGVAASSLAPVVVVPEGWRADERPAAPVVVGVKNAGHARELLGTAFASAYARGRSLVLLHAWKLPSGYDDLIADRVAAEEWAAPARAEMRALLPEWEAAYPEVDVTVRVVHDQAAHALVEASRACGELVVVRRAHGIPAALHLGPTARAVLRAAACPVRVVPPGLVIAEPGDAGGGAAPARPRDVAAVE